ncbi:MAG: acetyltransferase [Microthrixaceae bacterium]
MGTVPLLVVGAGGFAREAIEVVRALGPRPTWEVRGILDDDPALGGATVGGVPVLGPTSVLADHPDARVVVCVGNPRSFTGRAVLVERFGLPEDRYATLVHPAATVPSRCRPGPGSVVLAGAVFTAEVRVGCHVAVMPSVVLTHDVSVGDFATFASGVLVGGGVTVGTGAYLGAGAVIREGVNIGEWAMVGAGSVVLRDIPPGEVWVGNPARRLRDVSGVEHLVGRPGPRPGP